jgi:hypothetical protein
VKVKTDSLAMSRVAWIVVLFAYVALIAGVTFGMFYARDEVAPALDTREGHENWDAWRHEAADQAAGKGPVARREPKSVEPPLVVLMRDYFTVCLAGALFFTSLLFAVMVFVMQGMFKPSTNSAARPVTPSGPSI